MPLNFDEFPPEEGRIGIVTMTTTNAEGSYRAGGLWILRGVLVASAVSIAAPETAQAYLDPATGSMIIQIISGTVLGAILVVKTYWRRIKGYFSPDSSSLGKETRRPDDDK